MTDDRDIPVNEQIARAIEEAQRPFRERLLEVTGYWNSNVADQSPDAVAVRTLILAARIARETTGWIAVGDRLPDPGDEVLVLQGDDRILARRDTLGSFDWLLLVWINVATGKELYESEVTHWHAIPEPPPKGGDQ